MLEQAWSDLIASPVLVPGILTLVSTVVVTWLNSRGQWRKQETEEAHELRREANAIRDELRGDLRTVRERLSESERSRLKLAEERLSDRQKILDVETELRHQRGLVRTLQQMVGDRRADSARLEAAQSLDVDTLHAERLEVESVERRRPPAPEGE